MKNEIALIAYKCKQCGKMHYPFHDRCLACKGREFEQVSPQGNARLLTYTAIYYLPCGFEQRFLILGLGEFENKIKALGQIKAESISQLKVGMQVKPSWEPIRAQDGVDIYGLKFEPIE
jgi:uncharacterized OB-fold protein